MKRILFLALLIMIPCTTYSAISEEGVGILYGGDHAFSFQAAPGWVLDNESGVSQGLHAVFYQAGHTWRDATAIAYARAATKDEVVQDIPSLVQFNVDRFHENGSPNYKARFVKKIQTSDGKRTAHIFFFEGDAWGNYEAAGYVEEAKTINFIILSSRTEAAFRESLPAFESLLASYVFITDQVKIEDNPTSE
jgi:hypothetical protein